MRRPVCLALAITSLLVISSAAAHAQALAPSELHLTSPDQQTKTDLTQVFTKEPVRAIVKKTAPASRKNPAQAITRESVRTFAAEPVRPIETTIEKQSTSKTRWPFTGFSYKTPAGKKESVPVITQYYPKQIVYPFAKIDRHIDGRLMQAATIAQERAHAHSRSMCWHYVKEALLASGVIDSRPKSELARDAAQDLVSNYGFKRLSVTDPFAAPIGSVLVYGTSRSVGHVEFRTRDGFVSDFRSPTPSRRPLVGVYAKL